jgi:hypothetical protein
MTEANVPPSVQKEGFFPTWGGWLAGGAVVVVLLLVWVVLTFGIYKAPDQSLLGVNAPFPSDAATAIAARGQFGDMFGVANALFSGLAFTALIVSLSMQRRELALQRDELRLTRIAVELQRDELRLTREEMVLARRESASQAASLAEQAATMERQARNELLASQINVTGMLVQTCFKSLESNVGQSLVGQAIGGHPIDLISRYLSQLKSLQSKAEKLE